MAHLNRLMSCQSYLLVTVLIDSLGMLTLYVASSPSLSSHFLTLRNHYLIVPRIWSYVFVIDQSAICIYTRVTSGRTPVGTHLNTMSYLPRFDPQSLIRPWALAVFSQLAHSNSYNCQLLLLSPIMSSSSVTSVSQADIIKSSKPVHDVKVVTG